MGDTKRAICVLLSAAMARLRLILFLTALVIATECSATLPTKGKMIKPTKAGGMCVAATRGSIWCTNISEI